MTSVFATKRQFWPRSHGPLFEEGNNWTARTAAGTKFLLIVLEQPEVLPIAVLGLDSKAYKCLENRNNLTRILKALLDGERNPLRDLPADGVIHKLLRTQMHLKLEPEKDNIGPQTFQSDRSRLAE